MTDPAQELMFLLKGFMTKEQYEDLHILLMQKRSIALAQERLYLQFNGRRKLKRDIPEEKEAIDELNLLEKGKSPLFRKIEDLIESSQVPKRPKLSPQYGKILEHGRTPAMYNSLASSITLWLGQWGEVTAGYMAGTGRPEEPNIWRDRHVIPSLLQCIRDIRGEPDPTAPETTASHDANDVPEEDQEEDVRPG
jgi:hypothetical protein